MNSRAYALLTGLFILLLGAGIVSAYLWLRGSHQQTVPYLVETKGSVYGLVPQSTVYYRGIAVGKVESIGFDPQDPHKIRIRVAINVGTPIMEGTYATLKLQGVTGLSQLELDTSGSSQQRLQTSAEQPATIPMHPSLFDELSNRGSNLVDRLDQLVQNINNITDSANQGHIRHIIAQTDSATRNLSRLIEELHGSAKRLPAIADHIEASANGFDRLVTELNKVSGNVDQLVRQANEVTAHIDRATRTGQTAGQQLIDKTLPRLNATLDEIKDTAAGLHRLTRSLEQDPQQVLTGPRRQPPGPGEPGYQGGME